MLKELFTEVSESADVLLLCGDLTDYGLPAEAEVLAEDLHRYVKIPVLAVLGNHDFESGQHEDVLAVLEEAGVEMLDGACHQIGEIGFAGVCGFAGGFDEYSLNPWGEPIIKQFVQVTVDEALKLETALSRLDVKQRVVLMHYAPIRQTVEGEPVEIFPFLGSSRLEDPLNHYHVAVAFHGHAHRGAPEGRTSSDIPVFNVSIPVLRRSQPDRQPYRLFELDDM